LREGGWFSGPSRKVKINIDLIRDPCDKPPFNNTNPLRTNKQLRTLKPSENPPSQRFGVAGKTRRTTAENKTPI
jgi:hypothetical protein